MKIFASVRSAALMLGALLIVSPAVAPAASPALQPAAAGVPTIDWTLSPQRIASACASSIGRVKSRVGAVERVARGRRTFASVVLPLENAAADFSDELVAQTFLFYVSTDAKVRAASQQCAIDTGNVFSALAASPELYRALAEAKASGTARGVAQTKVTDLWLSAVRRSGAGLAEAKRREFVARSQEINDLEARFAANLANDGGSVTVSEDQAKSLPAEFVAAALKKNAGGGYALAANEATYGPFMENETDASARKQFYIAYVNRGGDANVKLLERALVARDRLAKAIGYPNYAAFVLADRMAGTPERVATFLKQIDTAVLPKAREELGELAALKGAPPDPWDRAFYENELRKTKYAVDQNEIKRYFPVQHVIESVLGIYQELLGVKFARIDVPVWQPQVQAYDVSDSATGKPLGRFYLDLYPRPGKFSHFANFGIVPRRELADGSIRLATSAIVGNWPQAAPGKPALLAHDDVVTFFHEFGHNMAALLADQPYATLTNGFRLDFIEAPSQMLENWAWEPAILKRVSADAVTGVPLPDGLIAKLVATRYVHYALFTATQAFYGTADQRFHTQKPPLDTTALWKTTLAEMTPGRYVEGTHPQASIDHFMNGYEAGYYGYLWSKVYAQDLFSRFKAEGLTNPATGLAYRRDILAPARLEEPDREVSQFLGRPMNPNAFYTELGIAPPHP
jgi:thimet oligopeptidase